MKTIDTVISKLNNDDVFYIDSREYLFIGKTTYKGITSYVACDQANGKFAGFLHNQSVRIPRPKPVRTAFWYKKKFLELINRSTEYNKVELEFNTICSRFYAEFKAATHGILQELGGKYEYARNDYIITFNDKLFDGVTVMLINTKTGKSVAVKHICSEKVTADNVQLILFELYRLYINQ